MIVAENTVTLGEIASVRMGKTILSKELTTDGVPVYSAGRDEGPWGFIPSSDLLFGANTIVISARGNIGYPRAPREQEFVSTQTTIAISLEDPALRPFVTLFLHLVNWASMTSQTTIPMITVKQVRQIKLSLPPLPEQRRIVARIEELFSRLDAGVAALRHAKAQLQRYRQSVLAAAVTGQLTQAWREQHPDTEPASRLLDRVLDQRREKWNGKGKYKEPERPDVSGMPGIPSSWKWARLDAVCAIGSGMSVSKNRKHKNPLEVPYLRVANVQRGRLVLDEVKRMEIERDRLPDLSLKTGDVLFNEGGDRDKLGRGWVWDGQIDPCITQNHVFRASPFDLEALLPKFLSHWGNTFGQQFFLDEGTQTTNLASINKGVLSSFPVPVPPLDEQRQIVAEVEARTTAIDHLEAELDRQIIRSNRLRQSTLAASFSGQL